MTRQYVFFEDPGHGWLEVTRAELRTLGIEDKISAYSYQSRDGRKVYLEEDGDLTTFLRAKRTLMGQLNYREVYHEDDRIRGLPPFRPEERAIRPEDFADLFGGAA